MQIVPAWLPVAGKFQSILFMLHVGCALTFAFEAKFEIEAKILFRLEAKKKPDIS
jgi:hypothetical protein